MARFAFYGSLRQGHYNYKRLVEPAPGMIFEGVKTIYGYILHDTGYGYPMAVKTESPDNKLVVELYYIPENEYSRSIHSMEMGAGYYPEEIVINDNKYTLYAFKQVQGTSRPIVTSGDWTEYEKTWGTR